MREGLLTWVNRRLALVACLMPMLGFGMDRLACLSMIETGDNDRVVGRAGEISRYQILKRAWHSVTNSTRYTDPATAKVVAVRLIEQRVRAFQAAYGRPPTDFEFYGLWNAPGQVMEQRVSRRVAERCQRFANLCACEPKPVQVTGLPQRPKAPVL